MKKKEREFEELAERFANAIKKLAESQNHLNNIQHYLARHFEEWLTKYANTPLDLTIELEEFGKIIFD